MKTRDDEDLFTSEESPVNKQMHFDTCVVEGCKYAMPKPGTMLSEFDFYCSNEYTCEGCELFDRPIRDKVREGVKDKEKEESEMTNLDAHIYSMYTTLIPPPPCNFNDWMWDDRKNYYKYVSENAKRMHKAIHQLERNSFDRFEVVANMIYKICAVVSVMSFGLLIVKELTKFLS